MRYQFISVLMSVLVAGSILTAHSEEGIEKTADKVSVDYLEMELKSIDGGSLRLSDFSGKVVLIVNTASKCGFVGQYEGLERLYRKYGEQGFVVIGFPCNDFKNQEPGSDSEILQFCQSNYDVTFPMMSKIHVKKEEDQHPLYEYLTTGSPFPGEITWNFNKFLLDRKGKVIGRFDTRTDPEDKQVIEAIETALR